MSSVDDRLRRLPNDPRDVTALGPHLCVGQTELGMQEPAIDACFGKLIRILADHRQPTMHCLI